MATISSPSINSLNQELQSLLTFTPNVYSKIESYYFSKEPKSKFNNDAQIQEMFYPKINPITNNYEHIGGIVSDYKDPNIYSSPGDYRALIECLSQSFPDFDFSATTSRNFKLIDSSERALNQINWNFQNLVPDSSSFTKKLSDFLSTEINQPSVYIYTYESDRPDAFSAMGCIFNMNYFIINEKLNQIILIHLQENGNNIDTEEIDSMLDDELHFETVWY